MPTSLAYAVFGTYFASSSERAFVRVVTPRCCILTFTALSLSMLTGVQSVLRRLFCIVIDLAFEGVLFPIS